jgi:hypothetical protein
VRGQGRLPAYWWAFSITFLMIVFGSGFLADQPGINRLFGTPNIAYLLSNVAFTLAGGSVQAYVHTLRHPTDVTWKPMRLHASLACVIACVVILGWLLSPVHVHSWTTFRDAPITPGTVLYDGVFHLYLLGVLADVAVCAVQQLRTTPDGDTSRSIGLVLIALGGVTDVIAHVLYLVRDVMQPIIGARALGAASTADVLTAVCLILIVTGTSAFLAGPRLVHYRRGRELVRELTPLWIRARTTYPDIILPGTGHRLGLKAERMIIEILDALRHLPVTPGPDGIRVVIAALEKPLPAGPSALSVLPPAHSRQDEEDMLLLLAHAYSKGQS